MIMNNDGKKNNSEVGFSFKSGKDFENWLSENNTKSNGIWVRIYKKDTKVEAVIGSELIDVLLCYGWITGPARKGNESYILWWVCPRRRNSIWSKINIGHAERLTKDKRMKPSGIAKIEKAKADGRWE